MPDVIGTAIIRIRPDLAGFKSSVASQVNTGTLQPHGEKAGRGFGNGLIAGSVRAVAPLAAVLGGVLAVKTLFLDPIKAAANFNQSMNVLQVTVGATGRQMKQLSAFAVKLGADQKLPTTSAKDAADAMTELAKAGFTTGQIMASTRAVLLLSTAANIDNSTSAQLVTKALNTFALPANQAARAVNIFAGAANASTASTTDIAYGLQNAGVAFHALHVPIEDAATALARMVNAGISGATAGAALNTAFTRLASPTKQAQALLSKYNIDLFNSHGQFIGIRQAIEQLHPVLGRMTQQQQLQFLSTLGGTRGMKALQIVLGESAGQWDKLRGAITKHGQAQAQADARTKGLAGAMSGFKSNLETLAITWGQKLQPVATRFVNFLNSQLPKVTQLIGFLGAEWGKHRQQITQALSTALGVIVNVFGWIQKNVPGYVQAAVGAASRFWAAHGAQIKQALSEAQQIILQVFTWIRDNVPRYVQQALAFASAWWAQHGAQVQRVASTIQSAVQTAFSFLVTYVPPTIRTVAAAVSAAWEAIRAKVNQVWPEVVRRVQTAIASIQGAINIGIAIWRNFHTQIEQALNAIKTLVTGILTAVVTIVKTNLNVLSDTFQVIGAVLRGDWSGVWNGLKSIVTDSVGGIVSAVKTLVVSSTSAAAQYGVAVIGAIVKGLVAIGAKVLSAMKGAVTSVVKTAANAATAALNIPVKIIAAIVSGLAAIGSTVLGALAPIGTAISSIAGEALGWAVSIGQAIVNGAISGIGGLAGAIRSAAEAAIKSGLSHLNPFSPVEHGGEVYIGDAIVRGAIKGLSKLAQQLKASLSVALRDAMSSAKQQLVGEAATISDAAGQILDKLAAKQKAALDATLKGQLASIDSALQARLSQLGNDPRVQRIGDIQKQLSDEQRAREDRDAKARVDATKATLDALKQQQGESDADFAARSAAATQDYNDAKQAQNDIALQRELDAKQTALDKETQDAKDAAAKQAADAQAAADAAKAQIDATTQAHKDAINQQLADETARFNDGKESWQDYQKAITRILTENGVPDMQTVGELMGTAFAEQFQADITAAVQQAAEIIKSILAGIVGVGTSTPPPIDPLAPLRDRLKAAEDKRAQDAKDRAKQERDDVAKARKDAIDKATTEAKTAKSAGGTTITADEKKQIAAAGDKAAAAVAARDDKATKALLAKDDEVIAALKELLAAAGKGADASAAVANALASGDPLSALQAILGTSR